MRKKLFCGLLAFALSPVLSADAGIISRFDAQNLALSDGAAVDSWASNVGSFTVTASGTASPTYRSSGMNGLPSLEFDGTTDVLKTATDMIGVRTVIAVATVDAGYPALAGLVSNGADKLNVRIDGTSLFYRSEGHAADGNEFYRGDGSVTGNDGIFVNNTQNGSFAVGQSHIVTSQSDTAHTYVDFWIGNASGTLARWWKGDVSEVILLDQVLTSDESAGVLHNLSEKWNFPTQFSATPSQIAAANAVGITVPEPASLGVVVLLAAGLLSRRRRV